jgi:hypothetical protein
VGLCTRGVTGRGRLESAGVGAPRFQVCACASPGALGFNTYVASWIGVVEHDAALVAGVGEVPSVVITVEV